MRSCLGHMSFDGRDADMRSIVFGIVDLSEETITGMPFSYILLDISEWRKYFLLFVASRFPSRSRTAMAVVSPGSIPTITGLASARKTPDKVLKKKK